MIQQQTNNHEGQGAGASRSNQVRQGQQPTVENQFQTPQAVLQTQKVLPTIVTSSWNYNVGIDHASCLKCIGVTPNIIHVSGITSWCSNGQAHLLRIDHVRHEYNKT
jgi:hypothetical protein